MGGVKYIVMAEVRWCGNTFERAFDGINAAIRAHMWATSLKREIEAFDVYDQVDPVQYQTWRVALDYA